MPAANITTKVDGLLQLWLGCRRVSDRHYHGFLEGASRDHEPPWQQKIFNCQLKAYFILLSFPVQPQMRHHQGPLPLGHLRPAMKANVVLVSIAGVDTGVQGRERPSKRPWYGPSALPHGPYPASPPRGSCAFADPLQGTMGHRGTAHIEVGSEAGGDCRLTNLRRVLRTASVGVRSSSSLRFLPSPRKGGGLQKTFYTPDSALAAQLELLMPG